MLIINKYTNPQTGAVSVCCHIMKNEKIIKSYKPMHEDDLELFKGRYKRAMINNVSHRSRLNFVEMLEGFWLLNFIKDCRLIPYNLLSFLYDQFYQSKLLRRIRYG